MLALMLQFYKHSNKCSQSPVHFCWFYVNIFFSGGGGDFLEGKQHSFFCGKVNIFVKNIFFWFLLFTGKHIHKQYLLFFNNFFIFIYLLSITFFFPSHFSPVFIECLSAFFFFFFLKKLPMHFNCRQFSLLVGQHRIQFLTTQRS